MILIRRLCRTGKPRYVSHDQAVKEIVRLRDEYTGDPEKRPRRAYPCEFCHGWHLTSQKRRIEPKE